MWLFDLISSGIGFAISQRRHQTELETEASSYIRQYYELRGLIPLCAIAAMYNREYPYSREMYREFCGLDKGVQNKILKKCQLKLRVKNDDNWYIKCLNKLKLSKEQKFPNDKTIFYDDGKYIEDSLIKCGKEAVDQNELMKLRNALRKDMKDAVLQKNYNFFAGLWNELGLYNEVENYCRVCFITTIIADTIAVYNTDRSKDEFGSPGCYDYERIETMEDMFLLTMFDIYINLVLQNKLRWNRICLLSKI